MAKPQLAITRTSDRLGWHSAVHGRFTFYKRFLTLWRLQLIKICFFFLFFDDNQYSQIGSQFNFRTADGKLEPRAQLFFAQACKGMDTRDQLANYYKS
jgi:hypothetical protein